MTSTDARRRRILRIAGTAGLGLALWRPLRAAELLPKSGPRVVVIGGGVAGAIAARTLRQANPALQVVLIERSPDYLALPGANWLLGGSRRAEEQRVRLDRLAAAHGVLLIKDEVSALDLAARQVVCRGGTLGYDQLIVAPGVALHGAAIEGYDAAAAERFPHAWLAGSEVLDLRRRLEAVPDGGLVVVALPAPPYRCPQAAYERVSQMAFYLQQARRRAKLIVLDASPAPTALGPLFTQLWDSRYPGLVEYRGGQTVTRVDAAQGRLVSSAESFAPALANLIPPQRAGRLAQAAGLTGEDGWCPVDHTTYASALAAEVHVIGDAAQADGQVKSAAAAYAQARACALNLAAAAQGRKPRPHVYANVVYSLADAREGASSVAVHRGEGRRPALQEKGGGVSPAWSAVEGEMARAWLDALLLEMMS